jgi:hypothetical protein
MSNQFNDFVVYEKFQSPKTNVYGRAMVNNNQESNKQNDKNMMVLQLEDAIAMSSYPKYLLDFMKNFLIDNYSDNDIVQIYLITDKEDNIFVIEYALSIELNGRNYKVYVLVYLPILFPNYPPEFYIEKTTNLGLNRFYNGKINSQDLKINLDYFLKFDPNKSNIGDIIDNLVINFTQEFPVYKDNNPNPNWKSGKCILDKSKVNKVSIPKKQKNYPKDNRYSNYQNNFEKNKYNNVKCEKLIDEEQDTFDDKTFLDFIRKQTKDIIAYNYLEFKEKYHIGGNLNNLKEMDNTLKQSINNKNMYEKNEKLKVQLEALKNIKSQLDLIENGITKELNESQNEQEKSFFEKCENIINIPDPKDMEYLIKIKDLEDYLVYLKKGYEKKIVEFDVMVNLTRALSREIFNLNYMRSRSKKKNYI